MSYKEKVKLLLTTMTQEALAFELRSSQPTISRIISGDYNEDRISRKLADEIDYQFDIYTELSKDGY